MQFFTFPEAGVWLQHIWLNLCSGEAAAGAIAAEMSPNTLNEALV